VEEVAVTKTVLWRLPKAVMKANVMRRTLLNGKEHDALGVRTFKCMLKASSLY
jgi:hypothetical protein